MHRVAAPSQQRLPTVYSLSTALTNDADANVFSTGDHVWYHSHTLGAHVLATVVGPSPSGPQFHHMRYIRPGGVTQVDHESAHLSRLKAVVVASPKSLHLCSICFHQLRVPQFALKYPCNLPPPLGGETVACYRGRLQGGGILCLAQCWHWCTIRIGCSATD